MKEEADKNAEADKAEREKIEARNKADNMLYVAEKSLKDAGDKVPTELKTEVEGKMKALKEKLESGNAADLEQLTADLSTSLQKIGQNMYNATGMTEETSPNQSQGQTEEKKKGDVEEGQVVE